VCRKVIFVVEEIVKLLPLGLLMIPIHMQRPDGTDMQKVVQPLGEALTKAHSLTEGKRSDAFNHQKAVAESLSALTWVCYSGKDCGMYP